jgi:hypothetical protein
MAVVVCEENQKAVRPPEVSPPVVHRQGLVAISEGNKLHEAYEPNPVIVVAATFRQYNQHVLPAAFALVGIVRAPERH